jgi:hypothetical protein
MKSLSRYVTLAILLFLSWQSYAQTTIVATGNYNTSQVWDADTVRLTGDVTVNGSLTIKPGTCLIFQGHYGLEADSILARGSINDSILITINDTTGFGNVNTPSGGWKHIEAVTYAEFDFCRIMHGKSINSDSQSPRYAGIIQITGWSYNPLLIQHSVIANNYSSSNLVTTFTNASAEINITGTTFKNNNFNAFRWWSMAKTYFDNCTFNRNSGYIFNTIFSNSSFKNNKNLGILTYSEGNMQLIKCKFRQNENLIIDLTNSFLISSELIENENVFISAFQAMGLEMSGNVIANNTFSHSIEISESGWNQRYCSLINNTFYNNRVSGSDAFITFVRSGYTRFYNNILVGNGNNNPGNIQVNFMGADDLDPLYGDFQHNLIEGGLKSIQYKDITGEYEHNIDAKPVFMNPALGDFSLASSSPGIDAGDSLLLTTHFPYQYDLLGNKRTAGANTDLGAIEYPGIPSNTKPTLNNLHTVILGKNEVGSVRIRFYDPDSLDTHTVTLGNQTGSLNIVPVLEDTTGCTFNIIPGTDWEGKTYIRAEVTDNHGNSDVDSFRVIVYTGLCGSISHDTILGPGVVHILCDLTVEEGARVDIAPGTTVLFEGNYSLTLMGKINLKGTKDNPVIFTASDTTGYSANGNTGWGGIIIKESYPDDTVLFSHTQFTFARPVRWGGYYDSYNNHGIISHADQQVINISGCLFANNTMTDDWAVLYSNGTIDSSIFSYNNAAFATGTAVSVTSSTYDFNHGGAVNQAGKVENCLISDNAGRGIQGCKNVSRSIIKNNGSYGVSGGDGGMNSAYAGNLIINNNGVGLSTGSYNSVIVNNTIANNATGGLSIDENAQLYNNIIFGNGTAASDLNIYLYGDAAASINFQNTLVDRNILNINTPGPNPTFTDCIDTVPEFVQPSLDDYRLRAGSPCINAGTTDLEGISLSITDLDGKPRIQDGFVDLGAFEYQTPVMPTQVPDHSNPADLKVYPNPTAGMVYVKYDAGIDRALNVTVMDMQGRIILQEKVQGTGSGMVYSIDLSGVENGVYLLMVDQHPVRIIKETGRTR